jgi:flagellar hook-length control protein FliK
MEIQLNPENLGKVNLTVVSKNGQLTASFVTENQITKEALENQLQTLKENMNNQGIKVEAIEVTVSNFSFGQSNQTESGSKQQKGSTKKSINLDDFNYADEELTDEQLLAAKVLEQSGGSVDYTA